MCEYFSIQIRIRTDYLIGLVYIYIHINFHIQIHIYI